VKETGTDKETGTATATEKEKEGQALNPCHSDFDSWPNFSSYTNKNKANSMMSGDSGRSYALYNENDPNKILKNYLASEFREAKEW